MNSHEKQQTHNLTLKWKALYLVSILIVLVAITYSFRIPKTKYTSIQHVTPEVSNCVLWMAPFLSGGGYSSEAWSYILALHQHQHQHQHPKTPNFRLRIEQHGDLQNVEFWEGLPVEMKKLASEFYQTECRSNETVVICHSEPGAWYPPLFQTLPCPPTPNYGDFKFVIGRTMFETDRVKPDHVSRCNQMDFVWVPTDFHVSTFIQSGVDPSKVVKIVQPVDANFFDPLKYTPLDLASIGTPVVLGPNSTDSSLRHNFVFLSVFKWEYRKGWDVLLQSYLKEFSKADGVSLYLLANPYHSDRDFDDRIVEFVKDSGLKRPVTDWAPVYVIDTHVPQFDLPRLYKAADAFVLPSRGEGWGRPIVEAMAMSLPVIATNYSGPTEYLREDNSYPLPVVKMSRVKEGPFKGHLWAEPSVDKLRVLMRRVMTNYDEAKAKGKRARDDMITRFSPQIVAGIVTDHVSQLLQNRVSKF